jgi:2-hydroxychromene-2-carboxylate isomerase
VAAKPAGGPIEFYFDPISPYGYLATTRIDAIGERHGREVDWRPVLLGITVMKVMGLPPLMQTPLKKDYVAHDKNRMAKLLGVPMVERPGGLPPGINSLAACRAFLWLKQTDPMLAKRFAKRICARLWAEGKDITAAEAVADEAAALGADRGAVLAAIDSPEMKSALKSSVEAAVAKGVFGVPTFIVDGEPIWGVDRLWMLEHWLAHGDWSPHR